MSVYRIVCKNPLITDVYVGSTTNLKKRSFDHKSACKKNKELKLYTTINANGSWVNWQVEELEAVVGDKKQLAIRERHWIELLKSSLNIQIPTQTLTEWYAKNKDKKALYYVANKERILKRMAEYRESKRHPVSDSS